jgi:N-acetylneuraminic acid mutarotase
MIVWGGNGAAGKLSTGGSYDPVSNSWTATTTTNAPSGRDGHAAVWTGSRMIVWGGFGTGYLNTGGRYDPASDSWTPTTTYGTPATQNRPSSAWSGTVAMFLNDAFPGGLYDPLLDTWSPMAGLPVSVGGLGVWTGQRLFAWGAGTGAGTPGRAFNYDPVSDSWTAASTANAPVDRLDPSVVWTGQQVLVWGGIPPLSSTPLGDGGRYDPSLDLWTPIALAGAPSPRTGHGAVWAGTRMIIWGGSNANYSATLSSGGRYDPVGDTWQPTSVVGAPDSRRSHSMVWTGAEVVVWGGENSQLLETGGRYDPIGDTWRPTSLTGAPAGRVRQSTVWSGTRMLLFGGTRSVTNSLGDLALYDPVSDQWSVGGTAGVPIARVDAAAVWMDRG